MLCLLYVWLRLSYLATPLVPGHAPHRDLYWEQRHEKVSFPLMHDEEGDLRLPEYPLPEKVEALLEQGKYSNVENKITKVR